MELTTICTGCERRDETGVGVCPACGRVARRLLRTTASVTATTPLVRSTLRDQLWIKVEGANPTGTFKDRVMALLAEEAVAAGARGAVVASSGNAAVAASAACLQRGLPLLVVVPTTIDPAKLRPLALRGTPVLRFGTDPSEAYGLARHLADRFGLQELASTFHSSGTELACRDIGHEVVAQLGVPPAAIAAAVSVGPVLVGAGNGVREAAGRTPALLAAQAAGCAPIVAAHDRGDDAVRPWTDPVTTAAGSIADRLTGYADEATHLLERIRETGGTATAYTDRELQELRSRLARHDGIDVELSSAAAIGAALAWTGAGPLVAVTTGAGWRDTLLGDATDDLPGLEGFAASTGIDELTEEVARWTGS